MPSQKKKCDYMANQVTQSNMNESLINVLKKMDMNIEKN